MKQKTDNIITNSHIEKAWVKTLKAKEEGEMFKAIRLFNEHDELVLSKEHQDSSARNALNCMIAEQEYDTTESYAVGEGTL